MYLDFIKDEDFSLAQKWSFAKDLWRRTLYFDVSIILPYIDEPNQCIITWTPTALGRYMGYSQYRDQAQRVVNDAGNVCWVVRVNGKEHLCTKYGPGFRFMEQAWIDDQKRRKHYPEFEEDDKKEVAVETN